MLFKQTVLVIFAVSLRKSLHTISLYFYNIHDIYTIDCIWVSESAPEARMTAFKGYVTVDGENIWSTLFALYTGILMNGMGSEVRINGDDMLFCVFSLIAINCMYSEPTN